MGRSWGYKLMGQTLAITYPLAICIYIYVYIHFTTKNKFAPRVWTTHESLKSRKLKATDIPSPALELDFAALIGQPGCMDDWGSLVAKSQAKRLKKKANHRYP